MNLEQRAQEIKNETTPNANTAERVGGLFVDIVKDYSGRLSYAGNGTTTISLDANTPKQIEGVWTQSRESNVVLNDNDIEVIEAGAYKCYGMFSFEGKQGRTYAIQLRKNGALICACNPLTEVANNRTINLLSFDVADFEQGDKLSLWLQSTSTETIEIYRGKIVLSK
jgi:hypothetical protein